MDALVLPGGLRRLFVSAGMAQLCFGTLQGKLVQATWRSRLMLVSNVVGTATAIVSACLLLPHWLRSQGGVFRWIFGFPGLCSGRSDCCRAS